jgi:hypothetical protein
MTDSFSIFSFSVLGKNYNDLELDFLGSKNYLPFLFHLYLNFIY